MSKGGGRVCVKQQHLLTPKAGLGKNNIKLDLKTVRNVKVDADDRNKIN